MRRLRITFAVLAAAVAMVVAFALVAPHVVDTAPARQAVSRWISGLLGQEVRIRGKMRFTLLPVFGFAVEDLSVSAPDAAAREPLARIRQASMAVAPWPLLRRRVIVERIHLQGARIELVRDADGHANWQGLSILSRDPGERTDKAADMMQFEEVSVTDGSLHFQDAVAGREILVSSIAFRRRGRGSRSFVLGAQAVCRQGPIAALEQLSATLHLTGDAVVAPDQERCAIEKADLRLTLQRQAPADASPLAVLRAVGSADLFNHLLELEKLRIAAKGGSLEGTVSGRIEAGSVNLDARLGLKIEALEELLAGLGLEVPPAAGYRLPHTADVKMALSARPGHLALTQIQGTVDGVAVAGDVSVDLGQPPSCQANLRTGELDLNAYLPPAPDQAGRKATPPAPPLFLDLSLDAEALSWKHYRLEQAALQMRCLPGNGIEVETATGRFAGGSWRLEGRLQPRDRNWGGRLILTARDAAVAELWPPGTPSPFARGRVDFDADLAADDLDPENFFESARGKVVVSTRRPLQLADGRQTEIQGRLAAILAPDKHLGLELELDSRSPELKIDLKGQGTWDPLALVLNGNRTSLAASSPALPGPDGPLHLEGGLALSLFQRRAAWHQARVSLPALGVTARGDLELAQVDGAPVIDASVDIEPLALRPFLEKLGWTVRPADPSALGQVSAAVRLHYDGQRLAVRELDLQADGTQVRGTVDIAAFRPFQARFKLAADRVDLDRYLPWRGSSGPSEPPSQAEPVDIRGELTIGRLTLFRLDAVDVSTRVLADRSALRFDPVHLTLYGGATGGMFTVALDDSETAWQTRAVANGVQLRQPLEILFERPILSGASDIEAHFWERRGGGGATVAGLNGSLDFTVRNGKIHGLRIVPEAGGADPQTRPAGSSDSGAEPFQPFDVLEGSWTMTDGVAVSEDHRLTATGLQMAAAGRVDFVQKRLDATLSADIPAIPVVYYALNGPFGDIRVRMDRTRLVLDTTTGIVTAPLKLGQGTLGVGAEILERGGQAIGDASGVQQLGQGAMAVGQGVLEMGRGVLELHKGGESLGEGARSVGEGVAGMGKGVVGLGRGALNTGLGALEGLGRRLEHLFGGGEKTTAAEGEEGQPGTE